MYNLVSPVNTFLNKQRKTVTDTKVFRLQSILSPALFIFFSVLYGFKEFIGEPIYCVGPNPLGDDKIQFVNSYCLTISTYSVNDYFNPEYYHKVPYPGVGQLQAHHRTTFHKYYIWIPFFFLLLAISFYAPRYLWKTIEGGHMKMLMEKLDSPIVEEETKRIRIKLLTDYVHATLGFNSGYAMAFFGCEILSLVLAVASFFGSDILLGHKFTTYGLEVVHFLRHGGPYNPMTVVFPKLTKCLVNMYGFSGNIQNLDYICTMSVNNFNDKIFLFLWFYIIGLCFISLNSVLLRFVVIFSARARLLILRHALGKSRQWIKIDNLGDLHVADWFIVHQLGKNIDTLAFVDFLDSLNRKSGSEESNSKTPA